MLQRRVGIHKVPNVLGRRLSFNRFMEKRGGRVSAGLFAAGSAVLIQQTASGSKSVILPALGASLLYASFPINHFSKRTASQNNIRTFTRLIGKKRLARATASTTKDIFLRDMILLSGYAKTPQERNVVRQVFRQTIQAEDRDFLVSYARKVARAEKNETLLLLAKDLRAGRGVPTRKLDFIAQRVFQGMLKRELADGMQVSQKITDLVIPYALMHTLDKFTIHDHKLSKEVLTQIRVQKQRFVQKVTIGAPPKNFDDLIADSIFYNSGSQLYTTLMHKFSNEKEVEAFINYFSTSFKSMSDYVMGSISIQMIEAQAQILASNKDRSSS